MSGSARLSPAFVLARHYVRHSVIICRLYGEEGLIVRERATPPRCRCTILVGSTDCPLVAGFVHDQFGLRPAIPILNIVDDVTCECLAAIPDGISGRRVARERIPRQAGNDQPGNRTEFTSNLALAWAQKNKITWHYGAGKPMHNAFCESFNSRMQDDYLFEGVSFSPQAKNHLFCQFYDCLA